MLAVSIVTWLILA